MESSILHRNQPQSYISNNSLEDAIGTPLTKTEIMVMVADVD